MESFLNGYLATVLLDGDKRDEKLGDLINCCYANSFHLDPRIEQALCLETLKTRVEDAKLDRETLALSRQVVPPADDPIDKEAGEPWELSLSVRKRYLNKILAQSRNQRSEVFYQKVEKEYSKKSIITLLNQALIEKSQTSKEELLEVQKEACLVMKQKRVSNGLLKIMSSPSEEGDQSNGGCQREQSMTPQSSQSAGYQGEFITIEELARRVVYDGEEIPIPSILPPRFEKAAEKAKKRIQELREEKEATEQSQVINIETETGRRDLNKDSNEANPQLEALEARLDTIAEQLEALTPPHPQFPAGDPSNVPVPANTIERRTELLEQCEQIRKELERGVELRTPGPRSDQQPLQKCLTGTPWKKKKQKRNSAIHRYSIGPAMNGNHSQRPNHS